MTPRFSLAGLCFLGALTVGCAPSIVAVPLAGQWPTVQVNSSADDAYEDATEQWTRSGSLRNGYREVATLRATLKSPAWRVARIGRAAAIGQWQAERIETALATARADDAAAYEVVALLATWDRRENDLDRAVRTIWSLVLIADDGTQLPSGTITRDKRPRAALRADYPHLSDFDEVYVVKFPRTVELMSPSTQKIRLRMVGPEGAIDVAWVAAR